MKNKFKIVSLTTREIAQLAKEYSEINEKEERIKEIKDYDIKDLKSYLKEVAEVDNKALSDLYDDMTLKNEIIEENKDDTEELNKMLIKIIESTNDEINEEELEKLSNEDKVEMLNKLSVDTFFGSQENENKKTTNKNKKATSIKGFLKKHKKLILIAALIGISIPAFSVFGPTVAPILATIRNVAVVAGLMGITVKTIHNKINKNKTNNKKENKIVKAIKNLISKAKKSKTKKQSFQITSERDKSILEPLTKSNAPVQTPVQTPTATPSVQTPTATTSVQTPVQQTGSVPTTHIITAENIGEQFELLNLKKSMINFVEINDLAGISENNQEVTLEQLAKEKKRLNEMKKMLDKGKALGASNTLGFIKQKTL